MAEMHGPPLSPTMIPDDLTIAQFMLDRPHPYRSTSRPVEAPWLVDDATGRKIGFEEIRARVFGLANTLSFDYGIRENDVVCLMSQNHVDYPLVIWALHRLGAIVTLTNPAFTSSELLYQLELTKVKAVVSDISSLSAVEEAATHYGIPQSRIILMDGNSSGRPKYATIDTLVQGGLANTACFEERRLAPGEGKTKIAIFCFSSGTTGKPKAVAIPHYAPIANVVQSALFWKSNGGSDSRFKPGDVSLGVLPFFHVYGLILGLFWFLFCGVTVVVVPKFNFIDMLKSISTYKVTHLMLVPPHAVLLCKSPETRQYDLFSVRLCLFGAAPLSAELTNQFVKLFPGAEVGQGYGMTETATLVLLYPLSQRVGTIGSAGHLLPGVSAKIVKADGSLAKVGEPGEFLIKTPAMALGYYQNEIATSETFINGYVHSGDEVAVDENGDFFVIDRLKELIKVRGFQVAPAELEGHLLDHTAVADACVVGVPDDYSGEVPFAFVSVDPDTAKLLKNDATGRESERLKEDIRKFVADTKVYYKRLEGGIEFIETVPKTPSGKLLRRVLRDQAKAIRARKLAEGGAESSAKAKL
ncbi:phenylacetyl-CoA ligase [Stereum hirsutum FP-91666 SS1]|uniref:Phenylacetyl-CoA ligase n=1 Tax=Stereum hirsutum (strain FP-91666) TaxID=721885 RepID=R7RZI8_STEHR|nr:phenylacetyl-CoA ligase [Stereum hirsutum FP-91666 SS1]EIM79727.1 phenylacetyl-CoA ligase [Stereum hirsutum FP-91666 SS1]